MLTNFLQEEGTKQSTLIYHKKEKNNTFYKLKIFNIASNQAEFLINLSRNKTMQLKNPDFKNCLNVHIYR